MNKPYYQDKWGEIYLGDCREILPELQKVDLVLTDPPYSLPASISATRKVFYRSITELSILEYFYRDFFSWCNSVTKPDAVYYIFCDGQSYPVFYSLLFGYVKALRPLVWDKQTSINGYTWRHQHELILFAENIDSPLIKTGDGDILKCRAVQVDKREHPAEKPTELITQLISKHKETCVVLDPFLGSGTTAVAAKKLNRHYIGIEISEKYCEIAARRLSQGVMVLDIPEIKPFTHVRKDSGCESCRCNNCGTGHYGLNDDIVKCRVTGTTECPGIAGDLSRAKPRDCKEREKC